MAPLFIQRTLTHPLAPYLLVAVFALAFPVLARLTRRGGRPPGASPKPRPRQAPFANVARDTNFTVRDRPFRHLIIDDFFANDFYRSLCADFQKRLSEGLIEAPSRTQFSKVGDYDAYACQMSPDHGPLSVFLSAGFDRYLSKAFGITSTLSVVGSLHHHKIGSANGWIHSDFIVGSILEDRLEDGANVWDCQCSYNDPPDRPGVYRHARSIAISYFLLNKPDWREGDGGELGLFTSYDPTSLVEKIAPINNRLAAFEISPNSFHAFMRNNTFERNSITVFLHADPEFIQRRFGSAPTPKATAATPSAASPPLKPLFSGLKPDHFLRKKDLGRTGLNVSELCLGGLPFGWYLDDAASFRILDRFFEVGGNFLDTADVYTSGVLGKLGGDSERVIGRWMKARRNRNSVVLSTKCGGRMWEGPDGAGLSRAHILRACGESLRRLGTDYIDVYLAHMDDVSAPQDETAEAFGLLVKQGKVRRLGCSNFSPDRLAAALDLSKKANVEAYSVIQPDYSLVCRTSYEGPMRQLCQARGIACTPFSPLGGGLLTGKFHRGQPNDSHRLDWIARYASPGADRIVGRLLALSADLGLPPAQLALRWVMAQPTVASPVTGASNDEQLEELLGATIAPIPQSVLDELTAVSGY